MATGAGLDPDVEGCGRAEDEGDVCCGARVYDGERDGLAAEVPGAYEGFEVGVERGLGDGCKVRVGRESGKEFGVGVGGWVCRRWRYLGDEGEERSDEVEEEVEKRSVRVHWGQERTVLRLYRRTCEDCCSDV
jgi:hypothetical protein